MSEPNEFISKKRVIEDIVARRLENPIRPVIFLDIDEVLNSGISRNPEAEWFQHNNLTMRHRNDQVNQYQFECFRSVALSQNAIVVIISAWLHCDNTIDHPDVKALRRFFKDVDIVGSLGTGGGLGGREKDIETVVELIGGKFWAVVDDALYLRNVMYTDEFVERYAGNCVAVHGRYGMQNSDFDRLNRICEYGMVDTPPNRIS